MAQENRPIIQPARFFINGILSSPEETKRPTGVMESDLAWKASWLFSRAVSHRKCTTPQLSSALLRNTFRKCL